MNNAFKQSKAVLGQQELFGDSDISNVSVYDGDSFSLLDNGYVQNSKIFRLSSNHKSSTQEQHRDNKLHSRSIIGNLLYYFNSYKQTIKNAYVKTIIANSTEKSKKL